MSSLGMEDLLKALKNLEEERAAVLDTNNNRTKRGVAEIQGEVEEIDDQIDDVIRMIDRAKGWGSGRYVGRRLREKAWAGKDNEQREMNEDGRYI